MARQRYRKDFKPKDFESYRKKSGYSLSEHERALNPERSERLEGDYLKGDDDYFGDKKRAEREAPRKERKTRPVKHGQKLIAHWDSRKVKRQDRGTSRSVNRKTKRGTRREGGRR